MALQLRALGIDRPSIWKVANGRTCFDGRCAYVRRSAGGYGWKYFDDDDHVFVEVTDVLVSGDLQVAKVYVHVTAESEEEKAFAVRALQGKAGYMRKQLAQRISLRRTPELRIMYDESIDEMERVDKHRQGIEAASAVLSDHYDRFPEPGCIPTRTLCRRYW